jgi:hypothetical protein
VNRWRESTDAGQVWQDSSHAYCQIPDSGNPIKPRQVDHNASCEGAYTRGCAAITQSLSRCSATSSSTRAHSICAGLRGVAVRMARRALTTTPSATVDSPPSTPYKVLRTLHAERDARLMRLVLPSNLNRHRETKTRRRAQVTR